MEHSSVRKTSMSDTPNATTESTDPTLASTEKWIVAANDSLSVEYPPNQTKQSRWMQRVHFAVGPSAGTKDQLICDEDMDSYDDERSSSSFVRNHERAKVDENYRKAISANHPNKTIIKEKEASTPERNMLARNPKENVAVRETPRTSNVSTCRKVPNPSRSMKLNIEPPPLLGGGLDHETRITASVLPSIPMPVVQVDRLTYDWSALDLDGTVAWNQWRQEWMFQNPVTLETTVPTTAARDMLRFVQSLKQALIQTVAPSADSPLHDALPQMSSRRPGTVPTNPSTGARLIKPPKHAAAFETKHSWMQRCTSLKLPRVDCLDDDLWPLLPRAAAVYYEMLAQQCSTTDARLRTYQYLTADELRAHVMQMERDVTVSLVEQEQRILHTAKQLGLHPPSLEPPAEETIPNHRSSGGTVDSGTPSAGVTTPGAPILLPQDDVSAILNVALSKRKRKRKYRCR